jgi:hypothetical protein
VQSVSNPSTLQLPASRTYKFAGMLIMRTCNAT